ncbi:MAG: hypothetical protein ACK5WN_18410, partial [Alphaproteobacteria bacterium]
RRITLNKAMSNTPAAPAQRAEASVRTWVKSQQQLHPKPGHFSAAFNKDAAISRDSLPLASRGFRMVERI